METFRFLNQSHVDSLNGCAKNDLENEAKYTFMFKYLTYSPLVLLLF